MRSDTARIGPAPGAWAGFALVLGLVVASPSAPAGEILGGASAEDAVKQAGEAQAVVDRLEPKTPLTATNYRSHYELANAYYDLDRKDLAEERYRRALELNPKYLEAMVNLGSLLSDLSRNEDAVKMFEDALAIDPEDCRARSNLGNTYYSMSRFPDAMFEYKRALELDPECHSALFNLGVAFADAGIFREAVRYWREVVRVAPGTEAARQAQENVNLLEPFVKGPIPPPR